jgi:hypothetical protein
MINLTFFINMASGLSGITSEFIKIVTESSFLIYWF